MGRKGVGVDDSDRTPARPWSTGILLAELAATELGEFLSIDRMPPGSVTILAKWIQRAVGKALEPERIDADRLCSELDRTHRMLANAHRTIAELEHRAAHAEADLEQARDAMKTRPP